MSQGTRNCRVAEWAELVGETVPEWACEDPPSRRASRRDRVE